MKIERLNDNQITFTLWKTDLEEYDLTITDLIGKRSEKAESLLKRLMDVAREDYDFEVEDSSLVVEAMQVNQDCLVFVVTKLGEGENLDPRYEFMQKIKENVQRLAESREDSSGMEELREERSKPSDKPLPTPMYAIYRFDSLDKIIEVSQLSYRFYDSDNTLYKNKKDGRYYLLITRNRNTEEEFKVVSRQLREFGTPIFQSYAYRYYIDEHFERIIHDNALQTLSEM